MPHTSIVTLSLHDALPIFGGEHHLGRAFGLDAHRVVALAEAVRALGEHAQRAEVAAEDQPDELQHEEQRHHDDLQLLDELLDRKSTRLNSSHGYISYAVFC